MSFQGDLIKAGIAADGSNVDIYNSNAQLIVDGPEFVKTVVTTITTAGNATLTAAQLIGGMIVRDPSGAARTDTTPTAAQIVSAIKNRNVGSSFVFKIRNAADAAETITLAGGTGVTLAAGNTNTVAQNNTKQFLVVLTNVAAGSEAVTIYSLGTAVH
jgi:hypothetical protein